MPELGIPEPKDRFRKDDQGEFMKTCQDLMCILDSHKVCKFTLYAGLHQPISAVAKMRDGVGYKP